MPIKILISGGGAASTIGIIRTLRETGRYQITTVDAVPYSYGFKIADSAYVVPFGGDPHFREALSAVVARELPRYIIPIVDEEIAAFHWLASQFPVRVVAPRPEFCRSAFDKWSTYEALRSAGIPVPETHLATVNPGSVQYPAVAKPRSGTGSRGIAYLNGPQDLESYLRNAARSADAYIVQRRISGKEYSVSAVVALDGTVLSVVPKESIIKRGMSLAAVTRNMPEIDAMCRQIQQRMQPNGPFNLQLLITEEGDPYVIEINPRFSGSIPLTIAAGVHEVDLIIRHAEGESIPAPVAFTPDLLMIRYNVDEYLPECEWQALLAERDLRKPCERAADGH